ncbi:CMRF35-like molecule 2 isoform X1 [Falco biarmicus]|uniref:CMRF35-like molecule 2 n=1 Tax=Falco rusticolus TaxID=120794 RepID=UPI0018869358|nr:CMRF35-like molecule 2 [Falco rusticolus]XP_056212957.1 CMRF35-like molecule 2 isoform X1 [Falco biarmicus]
MELLPLLTWALLPGCWAVRGPGAVQGFLGQSLSVTCTYKSSQEMLPKYWCKPGTVLTCNHDIVITSETRPYVRQDRFSIRDNRNLQSFTVTMEGLVKSDEGSYFCGVRNSILWPDDKDSVKVIVSPAPPSFSPASPYTTTTKCPDPTSSVSVPTQTAPREKAVQPGSDLSHNKGSSPPHLDVVGHILTPGIVVALLLLAVAVGILVILSRKRKKAPSGAAVEMDRTRSASHTGADALNYAVINHCTGIAESQLYSNVEAFRCSVNTATEYMEVKQSNKYLEEEKEATYASVHKSSMEQQEIYANVPLAPQPREEPSSAVREV